MATALTTALHYQSGWPARACLAFFTRFDNDGSGFEPFGPTRMMEEHENFGLAGGKLKVKRSPFKTLALELSVDSDRCWHEAEAQLYLELGLDAVEYHANWGRVRTRPSRHRDGQELPQ